MGVRSGIDESGASADELDASAILSDTSLLNCERSAADAVLDLDVAPGSELDVTINPASVPPASNMAIGALFDMSQHYL